MKVVWEEHEAILETNALCDPRLCYRRNNENAETIKAVQQKTFFLISRTVFLPHQFYLSLPFQSWCSCLVVGVWSLASRGCPVELSSLGAASWYAGTCGGAAGLRPWELSLHGRTEALIPPSPENCLASANQATHSLVSYGTLCPRKCCCSHVLYFPCLFYVIPVGGVGGDYLYLTANTSKAAAGWVRLKEVGCEEAPPPPSHRGVL